MDNGSLMTDDWKWVLRTATSTRPVSRFAGDVTQPATAKSAHAAVFSETRGILTVSAGEGGPTGAANQADLGTAFALAHFHSGQQYVAGERERGNRVAERCFPRRLSALPTVET